MLELTIQDMFSIATTTLAFLGIFFEIAPIKINPISNLLKFVGDNINKGLKEELATMQKSLDKLENELDKLGTTVDTNEIARIRHDILQFADDLHARKRKTREAFNHIFEIHVKYEELLEKNNLENGVVDEEYSFIRDKFKQCSEENSFR